MTKCVADAWGRVDTVVVIRGLKKCAVTVDGSENDVTIERVEYTMPNPTDDEQEEEYSLLDLDDGNESDGCGKKQCGRK